MLELLIREGHQFQIFSHNVTPVENAANGYSKHTHHISEEFLVLADVLHEGSSRVVHKYHSALKPPLVEEEHTILNISLELPIRYE